jgi:hypothetical protein
VLCCYWWSLWYVHRCVVFGDNTYLIIWTTPFTCSFLLTLPFRKLWQSKQDWFWSKKRKYRHIYMYVTQDMYNKSENINQSKIVLLLFTLRLFAFIAKLFSHYAQVWKLMPGCIPNIFLLQKEMSTCTILMLFQKRLYS